MAQKQDIGTGAGPGSGRGGSFGKELGGLLRQRFGELTGIGRHEPDVAPRSRGRLVLLWLAAVPLFLGGLACVGLATQTISELRGPASANGSPDWLLALAACFFIVMVASLFAAGFMLVRPQRPPLAVWVTTVVVGAGGAVLGAQQLAEADWRAFTNAGSGAAVFLVLSVYLFVVSAAGIWLLLTRPRPLPTEESAAEDAAADLG